MSEVEGKNFSKKLEFVRAKKDGSGFNVQFDLSRNEDIKKRWVFITMARQLTNTDVSNARFDYEKAMIFKLGFTDIGAILAVLTRREEAINKGKGLYHKFEKDGETNTSYLLLKKNDPKYGGYFMEFESKILKGAIPLSEGDAEVLKTLLYKAIEYMYGW